MPSILDRFPYPWHERLAQELHVTLTDLYPSSAGALFMADKVGIARGTINTDQAPILIWREILNATAAAALSRDLVKLVRDATPRNPKRPFLDALLAEAPAIAVDAEPRGQDAEPRFIRDSDEVSEPEALLFHDDLTIPTGRVTRLIGTLAELLRLAPSVCRVRAETPQGIQLGTAFRVGPDLLLTNHHVLHDKAGARATVVTAEFGYEEDADGNGLPTRAIPCDVASIAAEDADDWGIIRASEPLDAAWPILALSQAAVPVRGEAAFIIQHPGGDRKRIGFVRNQITAVDEAVVHYLTDTQTGSSGAPVLNARGQLIALHHAGGRPQEVAGKLPLRKNEGVRIPRVLQGLAAAKINVP